MKDQELINRLNKVVGKEFKYKGLCDVLGLSIKSGGAKQSQLDNLQMYCNLEKLDNPTRYVVKEVFDEAILGLGILNKNNKYQIMFEAALYQAFLRNDSQPLWLSNMEMLKLFQEVNENFSHACNKENMRKLGDEFIYMASMSQVVYKILRQWTRRRIDGMVKRGVADLSTGWRLYTKHKGKYGVYKVLKNVTDEDEIKTCKEVWNQAVREKLPEKWEGGWVPDWMWYGFERRVSEIVEERFGESYCDLKRVVILSPPSKKWLEQRLKEMYKDIEALTGINQEACNKILVTTQLDNRSGDEKKEFIKVNMSPKPPFLFKEKLKEKNKG